MVEVFKTDVSDSSQAEKLVDVIQKKLHHYKANFDLDDCDHILRVRSMTGPVEPYEVVELLRSLGFTAEVLPDEVPAAV